MTKKWSSTRSGDGLTKRAASKASRVDRGNALIKAQQEMRDADPRLSEEVVREMREDDWN